MYCNKNKNKSHYINEYQNDSKLKGNPCCASIQNEALTGSCIPITKFTVDATYLQKGNLTLTNIRLIIDSNFYEDFV